MVDYFWGKPTRVYKLDRDLRIDSPIKKTLTPVKKTLTPVKKTLTPISKVTPVQNSYKDIKMPFGKHKGELLADIPNSYLDWLLEQNFFEEKFREHWKMAKKEIEYRKKFNVCIR